MHNTNLPSAINHPLAGTSTSSTSNNINFICIPTVASGIRPAPQLRVRIQTAHVQHEYLDCLIAC